MTLSCTSRHVELINQEIGRLSVKYIPDKRTDLCSIVASEGARGVIILKGETTVPEIKSYLIKTLDEDGIPHADSILVLPDTSVNRKYMGLSTLSVVNLRKEPDHSSELVSQALLGTPVLILKSSGGWLLIRTPDKYISWTERSSIRAVTSDEFNEWKNSRRVVFLRNSGWLYSNPSSTSITGDLVSGCIMAMTGESGDQAHMMLPEGREGFTDKSSVLALDDFLKRRPADGDDIIGHALTLVGVPYLWGGSSSKGVDCSGFVQTVFFMNGLIMPRDASQQACCGDSVDISRDFSLLQKGDLLFFGSAKRISHVAIYKGDMEYIHSSGRVMVNSLDTTMVNFNRYRRNSLVKAKRIIGSHNSGIINLQEHPWY